VSTIDATAPLVMRLAHGDIVRAQSSVIVINHFNNLPPAGAEGAVDAALGGALSRRAAAGALDGHFGAATFIPAPTAFLAAHTVLVLGLGEVEKFRSARLPELGWSLVESLATVGIRDAATIVHGAGSGGVAPRAAATDLVRGICDGLVRIPGADCIRELTIVEFDEARLGEFAKGIGDARAPSRVHVYLQPEQLPLTDGGPVPQPESTVPEHLRIGITRAGPELKVVVVTDGSSVRVDKAEWPTETEENIVKRIDAEVLREADADARTRAMEAIGRQLYTAFLGWTNLDLQELLTKSRDSYLILGCDQMTVRLPWELLHDGDDYLSRSHLLCRQLEIAGAARSASYPPDDEVLRVLVVGDPLGDLEGAAREATEIAETLKQAPNVDVKSLIGGVTWQALSQELNNDYDVLHYAGHARFDELRHGASGLILKDGTLTADDLSTRTFLPRLIVANACNSAKADGDLFEGAPPTRDLVQGMLTAGARAVVGSLWKVDDEAAATFGRVLYEQLAPAGAAPSTIGEAVLKGREAVAEKHGAAQPAWAGYALYGSPWKTAR
jgi:CHAT domain-containing protein